MDGRVAWPPHGQRSQHVLFLTLFLFFGALVPGSSTVQSTLDAASTASPLDSTPSLSVSRTSALNVPPTSPPRSLTTLLTSSSTPNVATTSTTTMDDSPQGPSPLFPLADPTTTDQQRSESVFNYYFLFLAAFGLLLVVGLWMIHKRRQKKKEQMRLSGHNALARDLDGWVNTRRWVHGAWRPTAGFVRREEGFNEHGEAPPPYQTKTADTVLVQGPDGTPHDLAANLTIPLRTLSRDEIERSRLPGYEEASGTPSVQPDTTTAHITRQDTTDRRPNSSTREFAEIQTNQSSGERVP
jgi:hypothetical protein